MSNQTLLLNMIQSVPLTLLIFLNSPFKLLLVQNLIIVLLFSFFFNPSYLCIIMSYSTSSIFTTIEQDKKVSRTKWGQE